MVGVGILIAALCGVLDRVSTAPVAKAPIVASGERQPEWFSYKADTPVRRIAPAIAHAGERNRVRDSFLRFEHREARLCGKSHLQQLRGYRQ